MERDEFRTLMSQVYNNNEKLLKETEECKDIFISTNKSLLKSGVAELQNIIKRYGDDFNALKDLEIKVFDNYNILLNLFYTFEKNPLIIYNGEELRLKSIYYSIDPDAKITLNFKRVDTITFRLGQSELNVVYDECNIQRMYIRTQSAVIDITEDFLTNIPCYEKDERNFAIQFLKIVNAKQDGVSYFESLIQKALIEINKTAYSRVSEYKDSIGE